MRKLRQHEGVKSVLRTLGLLLLCPVVTGCADQINPPLALVAIDPATVTPSTATPATIRGRHFYNGAEVSVHGDPPVVDRAWSVFIGPVQVPNVTYGGLETLEIVVPAGLPLGPHDVRVASPTGQSAVLVDGLLVAEPPGLQVSIETAPGGIGEPVDDLLLLVGELVTLHAVLRDADGGYVDDASPTWSVGEAIGAVEPSEGPLAVFGAQQLGEGTIAATQPPAEADVVDVIVTTPCTTAADCADPCRSTSQCVDGKCLPGPVDKDSDGDGAIDALCGGDDCDDEPTGCGSGCFPGNVAADGCDGFDQDCDGSVDEDFTADASCGVGHCHTTNTPSSCLAGAETPCQPGQPLGPTDATCDGADDDCDGGADEDYLADASCGVGHCLTTNTPSSCVAGTETLCQPGQPLGPTDLTCDGVDDDCDGAADDDYVVDASCGVGLCQTTNTPSSCVAGTETLCQPGSPVTEGPVCDATCFDGIDNDCDGLQDWTAAACSSQVRRRLTFDNSGQAEHLVDFPVLVLLDGNNVDYGKVQDLGEDLRFVDADGVTVLSHEIESYNEPGLSTLWVRVPQIDASSSTDHIYLVYGNPGALDASNPAGVWTAAYEGVWHLSETPTSDPLAIDSTGNGHDGAFSNGMTAAAQVPGVLAGSLDFDGLDDELRNATMTATAQLTIEAWVSPDVLGSVHYTVVEFGNDGPWFGLDPGGWPEFWRSLSAGADGTTSLSLGVFSHIAVTHDGSLARFYVNGAPDGTESHPYNRTETGLGIGYNTMDTRFDGLVDEVRVSSVVRSPAWMAAQYLSMTDGFITYGAEQPVPAPVCP